MSTQILPLQNFRQTQVTVFRDADYLPQFFNTNLVDPARKVKILSNDLHAHIRIFYYQYLKMCFELENIDYDYYIRKIEQMINDPNFTFLFPPTDDPAFLNDTQAKSLIMEFFGVLGQGNNKVLKQLDNYPIMDYIFIRFFRSDLLHKGLCQDYDEYVPRDVLLDYLCQEFQVKVQVQGQCTIYIDTDIYVYEPQPEEVYLAYIQPSQTSQNKPQIKQGVITDSVREQVRPSIDNQQYNQGPMANKSSYIASQFFDYTTPNNNSVDLASLAHKVEAETVKTLPQENLLVKQTKPQPPIALTLPTKIQQIQRKPVEIQSKKITQTVRQQQFFTQSTKVVNKIQQKSSFNQQSKIQAVLYEDLAYKPKNQSPLVALPTTNSSNVSKTTSMKKNPFGLNVSNQFSSDQVISKMAQPSKSNVINMKTRARQYRNSLMSYIK